jgi:APA family basic amino acid/polyamine antiporter
MGLITSNMIGAGVFLSAGFMAQTMGPGTILLAWIVGAILAMAGARAYASVAMLVPRSGGEYRYLSELMHPFLGYLSGWASLLLGFTAPIAIDVLAAGAYAQALLPIIPPRLFAFLLVVMLTSMHASSLRFSRFTHVLLAGLNVLLVLSFAVVGLTLGSHDWPAWRPPITETGFPVAAFAGSLFYIAFAFSGWNAAAYVADEFRSPARDVPRAMVTACGAVAVLYLAVNWIFVANLQPSSASVVFEYETRRITLGHVVMSQIAGGFGGRVMSLITMIVFMSASSVMVLVGPRVYAEMARDGYLPRIFAAREGRPPVGSIVLQGVLALVLLFTHELQQILQNIGALLTLFTALTAATLFFVRWGRNDRVRPPMVSVFAAGIYVVSAAWMLYYGFRSSVQLLLWVAVSVLPAAVAFFLARRRASFARLHGE